MDVMSIMKSVPFDDTVTHMEWHTHLPYASMTLNNSDEVRIPVQQQDICVIPSLSYLYVEGKLLVETDNSAPKNTNFTNNAFAYLFDEIRYEINGVEVDRVRNPGIATTLKGYVSFNELNLRLMGNAGWISSSSNMDVSSGSTDNNGNFSFCVPLSSLFGFAEDYRKMIVNARHELVLIRSASDKNAVQWKPATPTDTVEAIKVKMEKLSWRIPYVTLSDEQRIALLKQLTKGTNIAVEYRGWELYEYPVLPSTTKQSWAVKTASQLEKPRYVIVAFQTSKKANMKENASHFNHCSLTNLKLHLNSVSYPYDDLKLDFSKNHYALLYDMYARFQESYYNTPARPLLGKDAFEKYAPIVVIDCSKQNESIRAAPVDIRLEFEVDKDFPANTSAYCLIIHDKSFTYNPSTNLVRPLN
jgi:hypothetical protein